MLIEEATEYAQSVNASFHQTSAKEGTGIQELFQDIADKFAA